MSSHRQIFRSSAIIGMSSAIKIVVGILKVKFLAVFLGPAAIGLMGLLQNIMGVASTIAGCGLSNSGVRQLSIAQIEEEDIILVRRALWHASLMLGLIGMALLWIFRVPIANLVFANSTHANDVGWLGLGVLMTVLMGAQTALFQGLRRISDLAKVNIIGSILAALFAISIVYATGIKGVVWYVVITPTLSVIVALYYSFQMPSLHGVYDLKAIYQQWQVMSKIGLPLMLAASMLIISQLFARSLIMKDFGLEQAGYYQAAWMISFLYIGFILNAMASDYYPRLTALIQDQQAAIKTVNEQTEMGLILAGPLILALLTFSPGIIQMLFTESFAPVVEILRWQLMGDIFKLLAWPLAFIIMAQGRGVLYAFTQFNWSAIYLLCLYYGLSQLGLVAAGISYFIASVLQVTVMFIVANKLIGFTGAPRNLLHFSLILLIGFSIMFLAIHSTTIITNVIGVLSIFLIGIYSIFRLNQLIELSKWLRKQGWLNSGK